MTVSDVTVIMKTYGNADFTQAAIWAIRRFYPDLRIVFADGHEETPFKPDWFGDAPRIPDTDLVWIPGGSCEDCQNAAMSIIETPYVLLMDNDTKVISPDAIPICLEAFSKYPDCAASGWYGLVVADYATRTAYVGTEFTSHMLLDATQAAFSIHKVASYRAVGGMPKEPFWLVPEALWKGIKPTPGFAGDLTICRRYRDAGYSIVSPRIAVPVLHWGRAVEWMPNAKGLTAFDKWWFENVNHIRCNPLNDWRTHATRALP